MISESIAINDKIEVPFVLDNSVGRDTNIFVNWEGDLAAKVSLFLPGGQEVTSGWVSADFQTEILFDYNNKLGITNNFDRFLV